MGMSTHVVGIRNLDGKFKNMLAVKNACVQAGIDFPLEVIEYFEANGVSEFDMHMEDEDLADEMVTIDINEEAWSSYQREMRDGCEIDITKLSPEIKAIRFYNSW